MNSFLISLFLTCLVSSFADFEIDTQAALTTDQFVCLAGQNFGMFTGRVYDPAGFIDETGIQNLKNAYQVFDRMNQEFHEVPLLVLIERGNWSTNQAQNQQFLMDLLKLIHPDVSLQQQGIAARSTLGRQQL
uniref:Uncharacterized protein n=1 Tax=Acrobeloides nanus TaxID=290746 RepID=A0A914EIQ9_9BILA